MTGPNSEIIISKRKDREIKKKVLVAGDPHSIASEGSTCKIKLWDITCSNQNGTVEVDLDSKYFKPNFNGRFTMGEADYYMDIDLEMCFATMLKGETASVSITYYNQQLNLAKIIQCNAEMLEIESEQLITDWTYEKLLDAAKKYKDKGVKLIKEKKICDAFRQFSKGLKFIIAMYPIDIEQVDEETVIEINELRIKLYNNLAFCQLHFNEYEATLSLCNKVIEYDENNMKARFRRCLAYMGLELWEEAYHDIKKVLAADPNDKLAQQNYNILKLKVQNINDNYNAIIKKMFQ